MVAALTLASLAVIIKHPGEYLTRKGEVVRIETVAAGRQFACKGVYSCGTVDHWHRSGRLYVGRESINDITGPYEA